MISGAHTAPLARTVANSTIVTPNRMKFQVATTWMCRAIGSAGLSPPMNSAITERSASVSSTTSAPVISKSRSMPERVIALDPVPHAGADVLRGHGADRGAERHRRHLDIGPQLHRDAERRRGVDAVAVDDADQRERRQRDDDHLDAHRKALDDDRADDRAVGHQVAQLAAAQPQRQVA